VTAQGTRSVPWAENKTKVSKRRKIRSSGTYAALRQPPLLPPPPALLNQAAAPQRPGDSGPMSKAEFYAYCKRTGQLALFFAMYPGG